MGVSSWLHSKAVSVCPVSKQWAIVTPDIFQISVSDSQNGEKTSFCS